MSYCQCCEKDTAELFEAIRDFMREHEKIVFVCKDCLENDTENLREVL